MSAFTLSFHTELSTTLRKEWESLWEVSEHATIFNSVAWYDMATQEYAPKGVLILTAHKGNKLMGIIAVSSSTLLDVPVLAPLSHDFVVEDAFLFASDDSELKNEFFGALFAKGNVFLPKLKTADAFRIQSAYPTAFLHLMSVNPYIETEPDPLRFMSDSNRKQQLRTARKNSESFSYEVVDSVDALPSALQAMVHIDLHSGKSKKDMDIFSKEENKKLFSNFVKYLGKHVRIALLTFEGKPIAYIFNFVYRDYCLNYQTSYLSEYRKLSPGKIVILKMLEYVQENKLRIFDFCGGISAYKQEFATNYFVQYNLLYSRNMMVRLWWRAVTLVRRLKQRLFPIKNTRDHEFLFRTDLVEDRKEEVTV